VFLAKSAESLEKKGVEFLFECKRVRKNVKEKRLGGKAPRFGGS
jgi:hypothetical protein